MMDAAEIARLRERLAFVGDTGTLGHIEPAVLTALLDALEQAQKENADWGEAVIGWTGPEATKALIADRDQAQQDAKDARALLAEARCSASAGLCARIEAMLEKKP
jgi:hypothetical protein